MSDRLNSAADAAAFLTEDESVKQSVQREVRESQVIWMLSNLRMSQGLSQREVADRMGCHPSKISKLESASDRNISWADVVLYANAVKHKPVLLFEPFDAPAADMIKFHVFSIRDRLEELRKLAVKLGRNDEISEQIHQFYGEVLFNFLAKFFDSYEALPIHDIHSDEAPQNAVAKLETCSQSEG